MLIDEAICVTIYKRSDTFFLPLGFFKQAALQCGGQFLPKEDWSHSLFLCCDAVAVSFWLQRPDKTTAFAMVSIDLEDVRSNFPELVDLWLWRHVNETWDEVRAHCTGSPTLSEYAHGRALELAQALSTYTQHHSGPGRLN